MVLSRFVQIVLCVGLVVAGFIIGFLGGYLTKRAIKVQPESDQLLDRNEDQTIADKLLDEIKPANIRRYLKHLTAKPHLAGTPADLQTAEELKAYWKDEVGLDRVKFYPFDVLLSYPEPDFPNRIVIKDGSDQNMFTTQLYEKILQPEQNQSGVVPPFNAYSASGEPKGDLVYVNYARVEDFIWLMDNEHIDPRGRICIARYGKIFRGDKAKFADRYGCEGLILYSDPADYTLHVQHAVYPDSWFLPGSGVQRGSLFLDGDALTPGYPSIKSAYRLPEDKANLPRIPVQPIGYDDARVFLGNMTGPEVNPDWKGSLNITYRLGPGFVEKNWKTQMLIRTHNKNVTTYNVMGFIEGAVEPDRYVLVGNHRDAWVFGAMDPTSGTAAMMELSRAFGVMLKTGWRPRRTIIFCSWGAEEHGIIGSREWVEFYGTILSRRAVAYLNVDIAMSGNFSFSPKAMPLLQQLLYESAKKISNPDPDEAAAGRKTVYDTWLHRQPALDKNGQPTGLPLILKLGSGSDFAPFVTKVGVTSVDLRYRFDFNLGLSSYPMYHSVYETFHLVETYYDRQFEYHTAIARIWAELTRRLADDDILPFDVKGYAQSLDVYVERVLDNYGDLMKTTKTDTGLGYLKEAVNHFKEAAGQFTEALKEANTSNPTLIRMYNDAMIQIDRMFIDPNGLPGRPLMRNVIFAPSIHNSYAGSTFPGWIDTLYELERTKTMAEEEEKAEIVKQQIAILTYSIEAAAASIKSFII